MQVRYLSLIPLLLFLCMSSKGQAQSNAFSRSDSLFKIYITSDAASAARELEVQGEMNLDPEDKAEYWFNVGLFMHRVGQLDSAIAANGKGVALARGKARKGKGLRYRGRIFQTLDQRDSSLACLKRSLAITPDEEIREHLILNKDLAETYLRLDQPDSTRRYLNLGFTILETQPDTSYLDRKAVFLSVNGQLQLYLSRYDSAMISFDQALGVYTQIGDIGSQAVTLSQIADILSIQGKQREAIGYYRRALERLEDFPKVSSLASLSNNLGLIYIRLGEVDSAKYCFQQALDIATEIGLPRLKANSHGNLTNVYLQTGPVDSVYRHAKASFTEFSNLGDNYGICLSMMILGEIDLDQGEVGKGFRELRSSRALAEQLNIPDLQKDSYLALSEAHQQYGSADSALYYYQQHVAVKDTIVSASVKKETERLRIKYETRLKEEENSRLTAELDWEMEKRVRERLTLVVVGLSVALLLLGLILSMYLRNQAKKRQLLLSEAEARHERTERARTQNRLAKALRQITEKDVLLTRLEEDYRESVTQGSFADKLHERINSNQDWMQFVIEFEMVYKGFFDSLHPQENKLSKTDLRMAALIKLNLSNKEIADVLSITLEGVKKAKHRLKKKLQLPAETNLNEFVSSTNA